MAVTRRRYLVVTCLDWTPAAWRAILVPMTTTDRHSSRRPIAELVTAAREARHMSQETLASQAGIALRTLQRRESGRTAWTTDELDAIAQALYLSMRDLIPSEY
jgi:ribosome-binding protein aMBF1 (putative translation factor)